MNPKFAHLFTALPAIVALFLDKTGQLSSNMTMVMMTLTGAFGLAHVASFFHSASVTNAANAASSIGKAISGIGDVIKNAQESAPKEAGK